MPSERSKRGNAQLTVADYRLLAEFRRQLRQFLAFSEKGARRAGLTPQQHQALLAVKGFSGDGSPTVGDLASSLVIRHHSAVGLVDRLVEAGYLRRDTDERDRRRVALSLTRKGEAGLEKVSATNREELRRMTPLLKPLIAQLAK